MNLCALIIHLDRATSRAKQVQSVKSVISIPTQVVSAVDSQSLLARDANAYSRRVVTPRYPFELQPAEIACFLSHRKCWEMIGEQELDAALVLEDDVDLDVSIFPAALTLALNNLRQGDFIRFPIKQREANGPTMARLNECSLNQLSRIGLGMCAQVVTREAARRLLDGTQQFDRPVDCFLQMRWLHGCRVMSVFPSGVSEVSHQLGGSTIGRQRESFGAKAYREIMRPVYRMNISRRDRKSFSAVLRT